MTAPSARESYIPFGDAGSLTTLAKMRRIVNDSIKMPIVVEAAHSVISGVAPRDYKGIAVAVRDWLTVNFRFVADPLGVELLRTPEYMIRQWDTNGIVTGDCDDAAILGASLAKAVGVQPLFVAIGFRRNGPFAHVYTTLTKDGKWYVSLDVTRPIGIHPQVFRRIEKVV